MRARQIRTFRANVVRITPIFSAGAAVDTQKHHQVAAMTYPSRVKVEVDCAIDPAGALRVLMQVTTDVDAWHLLIPAEQAAEIGAQLLEAAQLVVDTAPSQDHGV